MRVHVVEAIHPEPLRALKEKAQVVTWEDPAVMDLSQADGLIVRGARVTRQMLEQAPKLRVVGKHGVGLDAIDVAAAKELGKVVVYTPQANMEGVAELAVGLMLAAARYIPYGHRQLLAGAYTSICPKELNGVELQNKTLGLIGLGRIGRRVGEIVRLAFSMRVIGFDPFMSAEQCRALGLEKMDSVDELMAQADYISISVPLTPETTNLINARRLSLCKPTAILVNTARGNIVDEDALYAALKGGKLRAAGSDVFAVEPLAKDNPLLQLPNFVAMPHIGASTEESLARMGETVVADVISVLEGRAPMFPV